MPSPWERHRPKVTITIDPALLDRIDQARGPTPRAQWLEGAALSVLDGQTVGAPWAELARALGVSVQELLTRALSVLGTLAGRH